MAKRTISWETERNVNTPQEICTSRKWVIPNMNNSKFKLKQGTQTHSLRAETADRCLRATHYQTSYVSQGLKPKLAVKQSFAQSDCSLPNRLAPRSTKQKKVN